MPTRTFFNLPMEKQNKIISVSKAEFSQYSFYDASINRIINEADISRGSFYLYFKNKEDLFIYIAEEYKSELIDFIEQNLKNSKCDIFEVLLLIFDYITSKGTDKEHKDFLVMMFSNMNVKLINHLINFMGDNKFEKHIATFNNFINLQNLNVKNEKEFMYAIDILRSIMLDQLITFFSYNCEIEKAKEDLVSKFNLIRHGIEKKSY
jgi:AcrR family transcriptional regulator